VYAYKRFDPWSIGERYTFSTAVQKANLLFISGIAAVNPKTGKIVGKDSMVTQARFIFKQMGEALSEAGASFDDVVKTVDYITTTENYKDTAEIRREVFRNRFPAATGVVVSKLLHRDALIEIDAIAVLDEGKE
jgi:2-iminobutanoate/2-iminopropanoate deaminase